MELRRYCGGLYLALFQLILITNIRELQSRGVCHYFSDQEMSWPEALKTCQNMELCLAQFDDEKYYSILGEFLKGENRTEYWFGLMSESEYTYISDLKHPEYFPAGAEVSRGSKMCAFIRPTGDSTFSFSMGGCEKERRFICSEAFECDRVLKNTTFTTGQNNMPQCQVHSGDENGWYP